MGNGKNNIESYRDLVAWQRAYALGLGVYRCTREFPEHERFGLTSQLRRGGVSIASNIAEGYGRGSRSDYLRYLKIARGALFELETQLRFAVDLSYVDDEKYQGMVEQTNDVARVLSGLIRKLEDGEG